MKNIKYQSSILAGIYYLLTIILIILEYTFISIQKNEIVQQCQGSFQEALKKEKETFIIRKKFFYDVQKSSDNISADEKSNWCDQFFLLSEDPNRHRLDSISRQKLVENNLPITGFITCTIGETYTIPTHTELIKKEVYRKNKDKNQDIILKVYIDLPMIMLINRPYTYILLAVWLICTTGVAIYFRRVKSYQRNIILRTHIQTLSDNPHNNTLQPTGKEISKGYYWDIQHVCLQHEGKKIKLKGLNLKYFQAFINDQDFLLLYKQLAAFHHLNEKTELHIVKSRAYQVISQLKVTLKEVDIDIISIRDIGYQLLFNANQTKNNTSSLPKETKLKA